MVTKVRALLLLLGAPVFFGGGWAARAAGEGLFATGASPVPHERQEVASANVACTDHVAMDANRNLTTQVRDYKDRWLSAETEVRTAEARMAEASRGLPFGVAVDRGEWSRMGREGTLRLRVPCATWHAGPRLEIRGRTRGKASSRGPHDVALHAEIVGLSKEEIGTVEEAYERTHTRLWSKVRAVCEVTEEFQGSAEESPPETDHDRVELCRRAAILVASPATQRAVDDVTALLGAGGSSERARGLEERVLFTLAESPKDLFEEVVGVLGRERAVRAFEYGAMCLDEIVYVVRSGGA